MVDYAHEPEQHQNVAFGNFRLLPSSCDRGACLRAAEPFLVGAKDAMAKGRRRFRLAPCRLRKLAKHNGCGHIPLGQNRRRSLRSGVRSCFVCRQGGKGACIVLLLRNAIHDRPADWIRKQNGRTQRAAIWLCQFCGRRKGRPDRPCQLLRRREISRPSHSKRKILILRRSRPRQRQDARNRGSFLLGRPHPPFRAP